MIPAKIDVETILADLTRIGWRDYKVELACGLPRGWISKLRDGTTQDPAYSNAARLVNFHHDEMLRASANAQTLANTT
jgi:hypothetical protein